MCGRGGDDRRTGVRLNRGHDNCPARLCIHDCSCQRLRTEVNSIAANRRYKSRCRPRAGSGDFRRPRSIGNGIDQRDTSQISPSAFEYKMFIPVVAPESCWPLLRTANSSPLVHACRRSRKAQNSGWSRVAGDLIGTLTQIRWFEFVDPVAVCSGCVTSPTWHCADAPP